MSDSGSSYKKTKVNYHHSHWVTVNQCISDSFVKKNDRKNVKISHIKAANFALRGKCAFVSLIFFSHLFGDVTIIGKELQSFNYARHSWPLSSDGLFLPTVTRIMVISEDLWHSHLLLSISSGAVTTCFQNLVLPDQGSKPDLPHATRTLYYCLRWYNKVLRYV